MAYFYTCVRVFLTAHMGFVVISSKFTRKARWGLCTQPSVEEPTVKWWNRIMALLKTHLIGLMCMAHFCQLKYISGLKMIYILMMN